MIGTNKHHQACLGEHRRECSGGAEVLRCEQQASPGLVRMMRSALALQRQTRLILPDLLPNAASTAQEGSFTAFVPVMHKKIMATPESWHLDLF